MSKILIVEDDTKITEILREILRLKKYQVFTAHKKSHAESLIKNNDFEIVITDMCLTTGDADNRDGFEVIRYLRHIKPNSKIIVMTGCSSVDVMEEAYLIGVHYFIQKPFPV